MKVFVKGIVTAEDAEKSLEHGVDGIIVSNHGGRADDSGRGAIESLEEVSGVVQGRTPLFMDSGIRRGVDIFKALALGADAVLIGRPYIYGLGAFGQAGVERALDIPASCGWRCSHSARRHSLTLVPTASRDSERGVRLNEPKASLI